MAKKHRSGAKGGAAAVPVRVPGEASGIGGMVAIGVIAAVVFVLLTGWTVGALSLLLAPVFVGAATALVLRRPDTSAIVAGLAGFVGALVSVGVFSQAAFESFLTTAPAYANPDVPQTLYALVYAFVQTHPLGTSGGSGPLIAIVAGSVGTAAVAFGVAKLVETQRAQAATLRTAIGWTLVVVLALTSAYTINSVSAGSGSSQSDFSAQVNQEPADGSYAFDAVIYLKAYYRMLAGEGYYDALLHAAAGDSRHAEDKAQGREQVVRDGKYYGWAWAPWLIRRPVSFWMWRYLAPGGGGAIIGLAAILSALVMPAVYWGLRPRMGERALFAAAFLMPFVLFTSLSWNPFFPDYWAMLFVTFAVIALARGQWVATAVLMLIAASMRETIGPLMAIVAVIALFLWWREGRERKWLMRAAAFAGGFAVYLLLEQLHARAGAPYMGVEAPQTMLEFLFSRVPNPIDSKIMSATSYMMYPYGFFKIPGVLLWALAPLGAWVVLREKKPERLAVCALLVFWIGYMAVFGASSSYWGQFVMLPSLLWFGAGLASTDEGVAYIREELRSPGPRMPWKKANAAAKG